jgi:hypothetical protein
MWIVYRLFDYEDDFKWKKFELQSCRSRRKIQFSNKVYLHPSSNKKLQFFEKRLDPTVVGHGGRKVLQYHAPPTVVGHGCRSLPPSHMALDV